MASPAFRSYTQAYTTAVTSVTPTEPAGATTDDIIVAFIYVENTNPTTITPPTGWSDTFNGTTLKQDMVLSGQVWSLQAFWIRRGGSAPSYSSFSWSGASNVQHLTAAYSGAVASGDPWSFMAGAKRDDSSTNTYPDVSGTTLTADETLIWAGCNYVGIGTLTAPTGYTARHSTNGSDLALADKAQATATSVTSTGASSNSAGNHASILLGLQSVAAASDPAPSTVAVSATIPTPAIPLLGPATPSTVAVSATIPTPTIAVRSNPTVRSAASTGVSAACTTGVTVTKPTGVADGDVLFAFVSKTNYSNTAAFTCSGWTEISSGTRGTTTGNDRHVTILRKVITNAAGEGSNYTFVTTFGTVCSMCATIICVSGADTTTPEDISVPSITFGSNDATPASRDSTSVTAGALVLSYCQLSLGTTAVKTWGAPSGYTAPSGGDTSIAASSLNNQHGVAYKTLATAGAAGTNVWTHTVDDANTENSRAIVIVRPAATTIVTPAVVACAATIPAPTIDTTVSGDATATPSVVAISATVPSPTVVTTATPTPAVVAVSATVPAPVVSATASVLASVVSVAATVLAATILATATVAPSLVSAAATIPAPTITATATVTPDVVPISATVPAPTITVGTIITPSTVAALATVPSPTVTGSATVTPSAVAVSATIPSPTITATATVTPSVVPITVTVSAPTIITGTIVDPSVVPITVVVPAPTITGSATVEPSAVTISATIPAPTISASTNATATPTTVDVAATLPSPTITATATVTPTTVAASATIPAPTITTTVTVAPSVVPITVTVSAPTITATGTPTPATVAITTSVGAPVIDAASAIGDPGIVCLAVTAADVTLTATAPTVALATTAPTVALAVTCATLTLVATCATVALTLSEDC